MNYMSMHSLMTMHYLPKFDRRVVRYGVSWLLAIATSTIGVVVYA